MKKTIAVLALAVLTGPSLLAVDRGTPAEAKAMLAKAVAHYKGVGRTQALADFCRFSGIFLATAAGLFWSSSVTITP